MFVTVPTTMGRLAIATLTIALTATLAKLQVTTPFAWLTTP